MSIIATIFVKHVRCHFKNDVCGKMNVVKSLTTIYQFITDVFFCAAVQPHSLSALATSKAIMTVCMMCFIF